MSLENTVMICGIVSLLLIIIMFVCEFRFSKDKPKEEASVNIPQNIPKDNSDYKIEYYPISKKYFALYKGNYLRQWYATGTISTDSDIRFATKSDTQEGIQKLIDIHREYTIKDTVITIPAK